MPDQTTTYLIIMLLQHDDALVVLTVDGLPILNQIQLQHNHLAVSVTAP